MEGRKRTILYSVLAVLAFCAGIGVYFHAYGKQKEEVLAAGTTYFIDENGKIAVPPGGISTEARVTRGTEDNPFFALEIVPYEGYAEFGYLIDGCEPVDFSRCSSPWLEGYHRKKVKFFKDDPPFLMPEWETGTVVWVSDQENDQYGTMTRVTDGTGDYKQIPTECTYTLGGVGGYEKATQYASGQIKSNGDTVVDSWEADLSGVFVTFRYDIAATGVPRYSAVVNTNLKDGYYKYYSNEDGHWVYRAQGTDETKADFYVGAGTDYVIFVPDDHGEYVVDKVLGTENSGTLGAIIAAAEAVWDYSLRWGKLSTSNRQTALYREKEGYIGKEGGSYTRTIVKADYVKVETGTPGANFKWSPLSYERCLALTEAEKEAYKSPDHEAASFMLVRENLTVYEGYVHDNIFLRETVDLGYEMINGVRTPLRCDSCKSAGGTDTCDECERLVEQRIKDFHAIVYTVTPEDLNQNLDLIDRADIISISSTSKVGTSVGLYKEARREELFSRAGTPAASAVKNVEGATFATNQLDWDTALRIYERVALAECCCPIVFDTAAYKSVGSGTNVAEQKSAVSIPQTYGNGVTTYFNGKEGYSNNLYKLFMLLNQMKPAVFETLFGSLTGANFSVVDTTQTDKDGSKIKTCSFTKWNLPADAPQEQKNAMVYWNEYTFLPYELIPEQGKHKDILDSLEIMNSMGDTLYQFDSQGAQNMLSGCLYVFPTDNLMTLDFGNPNAGGLKNDQYGHEAYDYFDSVNGDDNGPPLGLGTALSLHFIVKKTQEEAKESLEEGAVNRDYRVLELLPSAASVYKPDAEWKLFMANYANTKGEVTVDRMTTSEFNGRQMDLLGKYDLIYIGVNKAAADVTMNFGGGTDYIYAHTGPGVTLDTSNAENGKLYGLLGAADIENRFVYSGNDLTNAARDKLLTYAKSGGPVLFATGFYTDNSALTEAPEIDRTSNVFALSEELKSDADSRRLYEPAFTGATHVEQARKLKSALGRGKIRLTVTEQPVKYDSVKTLDSAKYVTSGMLRYKFKVAATEGQEYTVQLFIDSNKDGVFTDGEQVAYELYPVEEDGTQGARITSGLVTGGNTYTVKSSLGTVTGSFHWKLAFVKDNVVHTSLDGVSAVKAAEAKQVKVLQILPETISSCTVYLPQDGEVIGSSVNIPGATTLQKQTTKRIYDSVRSLTEYEFSFVRKTQSEVVSLLGADENALMSEYDILVLGFADHYNGIADTALRTALEAFINGGKGVVYTNSVLSLPGAGSAAADFSSRFRERFGVDRYGITRVSTKGAASGLLAAYTSGISRDLPRKASSSTGAVQYVTANAGGVEYMLAQGIGNGTLFRYGQGMTSGVSTTKAAVINRGTITNYPYTLSDELSVSESLVPYYQLDLEKEATSVWLCLTGDGTTGLAGDYYNTTAHDVRNNYYVYSSGNVGYFGAGYNAGMTTDEVRLFINTLVGVYRPKPESAGIIVENADVAKVGAAYYLCVDLDSANKEKLIGKDSSSVYRIWYGGSIIERTGESKKVYFRIKDPNVIPAGQTAEYQLFFTIERNGTAVTENYVVYDAGGNPVTDFEADTTYYTFVRVTKESSGGETAIGETKLTITTESRYLEGSTEVFTGEKKTEVRIVPRGMFDLD